LFSIPLLLRVPEPASATAALAPGESIITAGFKRMSDTWGHIRRYRELFKYLVAFLIYNDGIGTIIGVAAIYGAELGFGAVELILALLLVQFVGIPYSLIFGRLPRAEDRRRPIYLAFILITLAALPVCGVLGARLLPANLSGAAPAPYSGAGVVAGQGVYPATAAQVQYSGEWQTESVPADLLGGDQDQPLASAAAPGASYELQFNGAQVEITYSAGPDHGVWQAFIDGQPAIDADTQQPLRIDAYSPTPRYGETIELEAGTSGEHTLRLENSGGRNPAATGARMTLLSIEVLPPVRQSNLGVVIGLIAGIEVIALALAWLVGKPLFSGMAAQLDTKRSVLLALMVYSVIAVWGYFINSVVEFWFLAWLVAIVQGGSQALSRSLYASMSPAAKSGEFFGLFGIMEKFSAIIGPALFAAAGYLFGSSRPAVLSLIVIFLIGGYLLMQVNVDEGRRVAQEEDAVLLEGE
jgi:MFS-type transporter involved in bile tolerance (Atg22 family)